MFKKLISTILVFVSVTGGRLYAAPAGIETVNINSDEIIKNTQCRMYGANFEWGGEEDIYLQGGININPEFTECFSECAPFNRMAGTSANNFYWKKAVGNLYQRTEQTIWGTTKVMRFGPVEWINSTKIADSNAGYIYTVNLNDTDNNIADLVEFLTGDGVINHNQGVNWAQKRQQYGINDPVTDIIWELGNEIDLYGTSAEDYTDRCKTAVDAIQSVDPDAKIAAHAHTYATEKVSGWQNWHRTVLRELGADLSYVTMHYYYPVGGSFKKGEEALEAVISDIGEITGRDDIKVIFSENAAATGSHQPDSGVLYRYPHTIKGVMQTAEFYLRMMKYPQVVATNYHSIRSASWALCYVEDDEVKPTAVYKLQRLFAEKMCGKTYAVSVSDEQNIYAGAVRTDRGVNIAIVNKNETESSRVKINLSGEWQIAAQNVIYAENPEADLYNGYNEIYEIREESKAAELSEEIIVKPLSITVLELEEKAGDTEFKQSFFTSDFGAYDRCITGASLENRPSEIMPDHIVGDNNGGTYKAVAADNMYFWDKDENGVYFRKKAGIEGFYGYFNRLQTTDQLTVSTAKYLSVLNTGADGVLQMTASGNSGYNQYTSFGKYDLNISGKSTVTAKIGIGINSPGEVKLELVQDRQEDDKVSSAIQLVRVDKNNNMYFAGHTEPVFTLVPMSYSTVSEKKNFVTLQINLYNDGENIAFSAKIFDNIGKLVSYIPPAEIDGELCGEFDLLKRQGGIRFAVSPSGWDLAKVFLIDELGFEKNTENEMVTENCSQSVKKLVKAEYDGNRLVSVSVYEVNGGEYEYCKGCTGDRKVKYFMFDSLEKLKSSNIRTEEKFGEKIIIAE